MQFVLTGFKHDEGLRIFEFQGIAANKTRSNFFVSADLMLIRRYGIRVQELQLLCLRLLEQHEFSEQEHTLIYAEEEMRQHMNLCAAECDAARKKIHAGPFRARARTESISKRGNPMENLLKEKNTITEELWRAWTEKGRRHDKAVARKMKACAGCVIGVLALVFAYYAFIVG